ncbi:XAC0095 family protein [Lysobacter auxotrophicus]|uniref:XAC0095-like domain-containing protein n=1 Tax=Lysobacter auxotrophicus TaxID=2992573 RepID=A0ABN6UG61_9GAMM|nr:hypothetical protein [Lysobacter auxotrophicus]BDU15310.1 hypothetical protein LA521A_05110 [Lysobacter auxotrophicus]
MRKHRRPAPSRSTCYVISDSARDTVTRTRDQLLLLACLSAARIRHDAAELELSPDALVTIFQRLCNDLDHALRDMKIGLPAAGQPA